MVSGVVVVSPDILFEQRHNSVPTVLSPLTGARVDLSVDCVYIIMQEVINSNWVFCLTALKLFLSFTVQPRSVTDTAGRQSALIKTAWPPTLPHRGVTGQWEEITAVYLHSPIAKPPL